MRLETRFTAIIGLCFAFGVCSAGFISFRLEARHAREEIKQKADMVLETALAVRAYTVEEVASAINRTKQDKFHAAQVPSFAAQSALNRLSAKLPEYSYRESALNPTNLGDRATDWEVGLLRQFQADPNRHEITGELGEGADRKYFVARPMRMTDPACLQCHSTPQAAPPEMLARYGSANGFGWKLGDIVAIQLVQVATASAEAKAFNSVLVTIGAITSIFVLSAAVMLLLLRRHVTHPLEALTHVALATSLDKPVGERQLSLDEGQFSELQNAILRLKTSVDHALRRIDKASPTPPDSTQHKPD